MGTPGKSAVTPWTPADRWVSFMTQRRPSQGLIGGRMREIDELYADSGEQLQQPHGVSRGTALKIGGFGLVGALAAFLPGRASAHANKVAANSICQGTASFCLDNCEGT